ETADTSKVQIVLSNATIHNADGPAIYVKQTDKCFITLASGTKNSLSDGAEYVLEEGSDEPYATLYSKDDLTINGTGALAVTSAYRHAICSKDDLAITGGTYTIDAAEDALRGRDCVKILDGDFTITAVADGIKSNRSDDATRGFVSIDGGTFDMTVGDDGIHAETLLRVMDGTISIDATDDAMHSNLEARIAGGSLTIATGDDAVHAETVLTIDGGTIDVTSCYEGYEAEKIYINGGETHIVATDDAINAATASTTDTATVDTTDGSTDTSATSEAPAAPSEAAPSGEMPSGTMPEGEAPSGTAPGGTIPDSEGTNENQQNGGRPDNAFNEGGMGMGSESCLIQINGGYTYIESGGDSIDSNGSVEITGGVLLVSGPTSGGDGAFDYDLEATVTGGTVLMVGSTGMAQNFTSGEQPFSFNTISGEAGQNVALADESGNVLTSFTSPKQFGMVLVTSPSFTEGGSYQIVVGGTVSGANADGYTDSGTVSGGTATSVTASTTATGGMGGLGSDGMGLGAGKGGSPRGGMQQGVATT
ncbi:MAG: carbohydrate-binding domain-containing protein, partial [Raoultibacter sp.]